LKILLIHSYYQYRGGEDAVFEQEFELLKQVGNVRALSFRNRNGWRGGFQFLFSIWNMSISRKVKRAIMEFKPDIVQIYNWHFATGPVVIRVAKKLNTKVTLNVANYRLLCPSATLVFQGKLFLRSIEKKSFPWEAVKRRVYRRSYIQTFWNAFIVFFHFKSGTWKMVDQYIVPTGIVKKLFNDYQSYLGIPAGKIVVKPNFSTGGSGIISPRARHFLYIGRLSEEKGIHVMLNAFENSPHKLTIAGSGPLVELVQEACSRFPNISYAGKQSKEAVREEMNRCTALVFPSICYETFGLVISEAYSNGCPVIATDIGSPADLVNEGVTGLHFTSGSAKSLRDRLDYWQNLTDAELMQYRKNCISAYQDLYTPEENRKQLLGIYHSLLYN
jgi:glycosyltransferase involved in cell wall biosynthesis